MNRPINQRDNATNLDPVFVHSRRESIVLLIGFGLFLLWSLGVSYFCGYAPDGEEAVRSVLGIPHWVFWGVAAPWLAANIFTFWFCLFYMTEDPLGEALDERPEPDVQIKDAQA